MEFEKININELLPQQAPFIMLDALTHFDEVITCTRMQIKADNLFVKNNKFTESGVIENIAQTCAARMGYINKYLCSGKVKIGFIGAIKNLVIEELPKVGDELKTTIEVVNEVFAITLVNAKVEVGDQLIATCEMKISITEMEGGEKRRGDKRRLDTGRGDKRRRDTRLLDTGRLDTGRLDTGQRDTRHETLNLVSNNLVSNNLASNSLASNSLVSNNLVSNNLVSNSLQASKTIDVRFSEVDSMNIVWHGSYAFYFEDAREAFGKKYGLGYLDIFDNGYYAPLVDLRFSYKKPLIYGRKARIDICFRNSESAKIIFDYEIYDLEDGSLIATGNSVQVFLDKQYQLVWTNPDFFTEWKRKYGLICTE